MNIHYKVRSFQRDQDRSKVEKLLNHGQEHAIVSAVRIDS